MQGFQVLLPIKLSGDAVWKCSTDADALVWLRFITSLKSFEML